MSTIDVVELVLAVLLWAAGAVLLLKAPGLTVGVVTSMILWPTVSPEACWLLLVTTVVASLVWRRWGPDQQPGLMAHPALGATALASAAAMLGTGAVRRVALGLLVAAAGWVAAAWLHLHRTTAAAVTVPVEPGRSAPAGDRPHDATRHLAAAGPCPICGGTLQASVQVPPHPTPEDLHHTAVRAECPTCESRLVGVIDPKRPQDGLVWFEMPTSPPHERADARGGAW